MQENGYECVWAKTTPIRGKISTYPLAQGRVAISGMPAAHFTVASSVAAASLAVRGRRTVCAYLLEGLQPHRGGLSQATTECYTDIADESAVRRCVTAPWVPPIQALE